MDHPLNQLLDELRTAISESVSASKEVAEVVQKIKEDGYDIVVVLSATITVKARGAGLSNSRARTSTPVRCNFNTQDVQFLKELHIKVNG